jgi:hypothetical protein
MAAQAIEDTIDNAIYDRIPDAWWSDESFMALLRNAVNPPRFAYFLERLERHFGAASTRLDSTTRTSPTRRSSFRCSTSAAAAGCLPSASRRSAAT